MRIFRAAYKNEIRAEQMIQDAQQSKFQVKGGRQSLDLVIAIHALRAQRLHGDRICFCELVQPFDDQTLGDRWPFHIALTTDGLKVSNGLVAGLLPELPEHASFRD